MYEPEKRSKMYLVIVAACASLIGWAFFTYYRPLLIDASCSEVAVQASSISLKKRYEIDPFYNYDNVKARCKEDVNIPQE
jgi:hypothetical protein